MSKWEEKRLEDIIDVNPPVKLKKGESYPFIDIDKVSPTRRSVTNEEVKVYDGQSSSKFCDGDTVFSRITPCLENEFFFEWLKVENEKENPDRKAIRENCTSLEYFIAGLCKPKNLLDYIENFILYDRRRTKIIAKNHQFFGVNNAYNAFLRREKLKGKLGVFWHTQGSGKSYSMVMLARKIKHKCTGNFTFLIVTDREDLDTQIYKNFLRTEFITDKDKVQPANSKQLREELKTNKSILFTLIHKFRYDKNCRRLNWSCLTFLEKNSLLSMKKSV